ncbi:MAG: mannose-phosphate guanylyltransferase [Kosmotogales bacterium]|nr:mannose-phosphate guanylyltransferase [Kosmotogales bacterium]
MKAMILCAGAGTRLQPFTFSTPKPLLPIFNKPIIDFIIEQLKKHKIEKIVLNTSHFSNLIEEYAGNGSRYGVNIAVSFEGFLENDEIIPNPMGSAGGMKLIQDKWNFFDETFIVLCGDAVINFDISAALKHHKRNNAIATIITKEVSEEQVSNYGIVVTNKKGLVSSFQEKPEIKEAKSNFANTGIYIFEPEIFKYIPTDEFFDIGGDLFPKLVKKNEKIYSYDGDVLWLDIGRVKDYIMILRKILNNQIKGMNLFKKGDAGIKTENAVKIGKDVHIEPPVYISSGSIVEDGVNLIGPVFIGKNSIINGHTTIKNSFIGEYSKINSGSNIEDSYLTPDFYIDKEFNYVNTEQSKYKDSIKDWRRR